MRIGQHMDIDFNLFKNNKYTRWYFNLINHRINIKYQGCGEYHHFIPKSIIPNDNLVYLSYREHYVAHLLLTKAVVDDYVDKMLYAITAMKIKTAKQCKFNSKLFEQLKYKANSSRSFKMKGHSVSETTRQKLSVHNTGKKLSDETRKKISASNKGKKHTPEHIAKVAAFHTGRKRSDETKKRLREERATRIPLVCPHCLKSILPGNYHRWHGDNCKSNPQRSYHDELEQVLTP